MPLPIRNASEPVLGSLYSSTAKLARVSPISDCVNDVWDKFLLRRSRQEITDGNCRVVDHISVDWP